jgi:hypothetical protein
MTRRALAVALIWVTCVTALFAQSGEIRVTPVVADGQLLTSLVQPGAFTEDARAVVQSGLLLTFKFAIALRRPNGLWWDQTLREVAAAASVKFDNLTGSYLVSKSVDDHVVWSDRTMDLAQARAWMTTFERVPLGTGSSLEPNEEYYVHVRMWATPRRTFSLWPWRGDDGAGRAGFTNIR